MSQQRDERIFGAFDSPQTAANVTGGSVYQIGNRDPRSGFILVDKHDNHFVYVHTSYSGYRDVAADVVGVKLSKTGDDADHAASREVEESLGNSYVLLARVPSAANRSAGTVEKLTSLDRKFNHASLAAHYGGGTGTATPLSQRQIQKLKGLKVSSYDNRNSTSADLTGDPDIQRALMLSADTQQRIKKLCGSKITSFSHSPETRVTPDATGIKGPWQRRQPVASATQPGRVKKP